MSKANCMDARKELEKNVARKNHSVPSTSIRIVHLLCTNWSMRFKSTKYNNGN